MHGEARAIFRRTHVASVAPGPRDDSRADAPDPPSARRSRDDEARRLDLWFVARCRKLLFRSDLQTSGRPGPARADRGRLEGSDLGPLTKEDESPVRSEHSRLSSWRGTWKRSCVAGLGEQSERSESAGAAHTIVEQSNSMMHGWSYLTYSYTYNDTVNGH
jgi:hypothetical protein